MESKKRIKIIFLVLVIIAVITGSVIGISKTSNKPLEIQLIDKETSEYLVMNVPANYSFHIVRDGDGDVKVCELDGKIVNTRVTDNGTEIEIKPPSGGYEPGEVYTLDISKVGSFSDKDLEKAKMIMFVIKKKNESNVTYTNKVKDLSNAQATVTDNKISLKGTYQNGDIVLVDTDEDGIQEIYKLGEVSHQQDKTIATYSDPEAAEVYKDIDIFFYDNIDMDNIVIDEEKLYGNLKEAGILDIVFDDVYADEKDDLPEIKFDVKKKSNDEKYSMQIEVKYPGKPVKLIIKCEVACKTFYKNKNKTVVLNNSLTIGGNVQISVEGELGEVKEEEIRKSIEKFVSLKGAETDAMDYEIPIVPIKMPICGPIYLKFDLGMKGSLEISGKIKFDVRDELILTEGIVYDYNKTKIIKKYCEVEPILDASVSLEGKAEAFAGFYADGGVVVPLLITAEVKGQVGPYFEAKGCLILQEIPENPKLEGYYNFETGIKYDANIKIKLLKKAKIKIPLVDDKISVWAKSNGERLKDVDFSDSYTLTDGSVQIGDLHATYHDVIENKDNVELLKDYELYVDGSQVNIEDGNLAFNKEPGEYTFKVEWEKDAIPYEYEKKIKIEENMYDPEKIKFLTDYIWNASFSVTIGGLHYIRFNGDGSLDMVHASTGDYSSGTYTYSDGVLVLSIDNNMIECVNERFRGNELEFESINTHIAQFPNETNYRLSRIDDNEEYFASLSDSDMDMAVNFNLLANIGTEY